MELIQFFLNNPSVFFCLVYLFSLPTFFLVLTKYIEAQKDITIAKNNNEFYIEVNRLNRINDLNNSLTQIIKQLINHD